MTLLHPAYIIPNSNNGRSIIIYSTHPATRSKLRILLSTQRDQRSLEHVYALDCVHGDHYAGSANLRPNINPSRFICVHTACVCTRSALSLIADSRLQPRPYINSIIAGAFEREYDQPFDPSFITLSRRYESTKSRGEDTFRLDSFFLLDTWKDILSILLTEHAMIYEFLPREGRYG